MNINGNHPSQGYSEEDSHLDSKDGVEREEAFERAQSPKSVNPGLLLRGKNFKKKKVLLLFNGKRGQY